ncbi:2-dehydro-3-deoxygluconokinase [Suicoccus acidiformans]|uniref:2-dehydro-3-deoxygluconokinase n=1 Tax=Suicoccus acidiformans TaxID=2036206 RepID=A0A347WIH1_9LACT|nr:sugar kinase [Suicoccus acidiformans]AXY24878.1 2-dehydro-3-deoxygluconokinase [Suicoccus acidiformans]
MLDVVTFGEPLFMFYANETGDLEDVNSFSRALAGAETNVVTGVSRLGMKAGQVTKLGDDMFGRFLIRAMEAEGLDTNGVQVDPNERTGMYVKAKVDQGDPPTEYFRKGSAASKISPEDFDAEYFNNARHLHMTSIPAALSDSSFDFTFKVAKEVKQMGKSISFDPNLRPTLWSSQDKMIDAVNELVQYCDIFLPGVSEGQILIRKEDATPEEIAQFYIEKGVPTVVVKVGDKGAYYATHDGQTGTVPGYSVEVVDTVGAGDGFAVGVTTGLLEGLSLEEAILRGNAIGALQVNHPGDNDGLPTQEQLKVFMDTHTPGE